MTRVERISYWAWTAIFLALLVLGAATSRAGDLRLTWNDGGGPVADGYRVYTGTASGNYGNVDVGMNMVHNFTGLPDCQDNYFAVKAYNAGGESEFSIEVSTYPRPVITDVTSSQAGAHTILGNNFSVAPRVFVSAGGGGFVEVDSEDVQRLSCGELRIPDVPMLQLKVANLALPTGSGEPEYVFSQPWPGPVNLTVE